MVDSSMIDIKCFASGLRTGSPGHKKCGDLPAKNKTIFHSYVDQNVEAYPFDDRTHGDRIYIYIYVYTGWWFHIPN